VQLKEYHRKKTSPFLRKLNEELDCFPGAKITIKEFKNGTPEDAPIEYDFLRPPTWIH
jgi:hypothetical protein